MGQAYRTEGTFSDETLKDERNRMVFREMFAIIKAAWTQDTLQYNGDFFQVPSPYEDGIRGWPSQEWTRSRGAPGELDEEGVIRGVSVVPKPYQQPHPPIFLAFSVSDSTILWAAQQDIIPHIQISHPENFKRLCRLYQEESAKCGRDMKLGENVGAARVPLIGKTREEAYQLAVETVGWSYHNYFNLFGFGEAFRYPGETAPRPLHFKSVEDATKRAVDHQFAIVGTVDEVKRQVESVARCHDDGELGWFGFNLDQGQYPFEKVMEQVEIFGTKIMPEFQG